MSLNEGVCAIKRALVHDLDSSHRQLVALGDQEVAAAAAGDLATVRALEPSLAKARERRRHALAALRVHIEHHGC